MIKLVATAGSETCAPIHFVGPETWRERAEAVGPVALAFAEASGFAGAPGAVLLAPAADGRLGAVLFGDDAGAGRRDPFHAGRLASSLPAGCYSLPDDVG